MPFQIIRNDITKVEADAIVNTANPRPVIGDGTDRAIYEAAGKELLLAERKKIGALNIGEAAVTPGFALPSRYIIHVTGPVWDTGSEDEIRGLKETYLAALRKASELGCESVAFPLISSGSYGFPKVTALKTAVDVFSEWLLKHEVLITLVVFGSEAYSLSNRLFRGINSYIDEHYVGEQKRREYTHQRISRQTEAKLNHLFRIRGVLPTYYEERYPETAEAFYELKELEVGQEGCFGASAAPAPEAMAVSNGIKGKDDREKKRISPPVGMAASAAMPAGNLEELLAAREETFQQRLLRLIDEKHMRDPEVYKRANISRKHFSKIRCNPDYKPNKKTALALAIALELDLDETKDLLERAELALSPSSQFDLIISWFILKHNYNIFDINIALFDHAQPLLGF